MENRNYRNIAIECQKIGDNNKAIKFFLMGIENGESLACIDMTLEMKYISDNYKYSEESLQALNPKSFDYYLDLGINMGCLDCMFYKAREQYFGEYLKYSKEEALTTFLYLESKGYEPDYFDDDYSISDYIEMLKSK